MTVFKDLAYRLRLVKKSLPEILRDAIIEHREFIAELNRQQLWMGERSDGTMLPFYKEGSKQPNAPGRIVLFDEGDFHDGIDISIDDSSFEMVGVDEKTAILLHNYGQMILGLNEENINELRAKIKPFIQDRINTILAV